MKISWGYKIAMVYLVFVAGIAYLVYRANQEKFDLVNKDYYEQELKYQEVIDQSANASRLSMPVKVEKNESDLKIIFPDELKGKKKNIGFYLYCPSDARRDFKINLETGENEIRQALPAGTAGQYELKLSWETEGVKYYHEQKIFF
jgi:hypothetical protein